MIRSLSVALTFFSLFILSPVSLADTTSVPYPVVPARTGERCTVCGASLSENDVALIVKGRRVPLCRTMVQDFLRNQDKYFAKLEPRGALFQENMESPDGTALGGISNGWFLFGLWVLFALVFAGLSGYVAVGRGLTPIRHFFIGLIFSAVGFVYVLTRPKVVREGDIPEGLTKVPSTASPMICANCGSANHPSARKCSMCGAELKPRVESEASRVLKEG